MQERMEKYDCLKLENQLCFPLYAVAKEVTRNYKTLLKEMDLTYTQYITMLVLWEKRELCVKDLGRYLFLDSGTMTPVLKTLEKKGYLTRNRSKKDERNLIVALTEAGMSLRDQAVDIPSKMLSTLPLSGEDERELYRILGNIMKDMRQDWKTDEESEA